MKFETPEPGTEKLIYEDNESHGHFSLFADLTEGEHVGPLQMCLKSITSDDARTVYEGTNPFGDKITVTVDVVANPSPTAPKGHG